jgi:hypothetical protein
VASEKVQTIAGLIREGGPIGLYVDDDGRNCHQIFRETGTPVLNWSTMEGEGIEEPGTWYNPVRPDGGPMIIDRSWPAAKVNSGNRFFG